MVELSRLLSEMLLRQIFAKGKCLFVKDSIKFTEYKMIKFAAIAEFGYYRNLMHRGIIKRIKREKEL